MNILYRIVRRLVNTCLYNKTGLNRGGLIDVREAVYFDRPEQVYIGDNSLINYGCKFIIGFSKEAKIKIGKNVQIGMNCTFTCVSHAVGQKEQRAGKNFYKDIVVQDGCWIGASCTILPAVSIANGCVIAAGSVVTKSTEANGLYAGVPAKRIKDL